MRVIVVSGVLLQLFTGYYFLKNSSITDERHFISLLSHPVADPQHDDNRDLANYINSLPDNSQVLVDDAIAYPIVAFVKDIKKVILPYQEKFLTAIEAPKGSVNYLLIATSKNSVTGYTQLNNKYFEIIKGANGALGMQIVYETDDWVLYKIM